MSLAPKNTVPMITDPPAEATKFKPCSSCIHPDQMSCACPCHTHPLDQIEFVSGVGMRVKETIDHPLHYGGDVIYEHIKVVAAWWPELFAGYCLGNATKYLCRAGKKDPAKELEDLRKARFYLDALIKEKERDRV